MSKLKSKFDNVVYYKDGVREQPKLHIRSLGLNKKLDSIYKQPKVVDRKRPLEQRVKRKAKPSMFEIGGEIAGNPKSDMLLLDEKGQVQMGLEGKERIFSRVHTRQIMNLIKNAKDERGLIKLGKKVAEIIKIHDTQPQEYTTE